MSNSQDDLLKVMTDECHVQSKKSNEYVITSRCLYLILLDSWYYFTWKEKATLDESIIAWIQDWQESNCVIVCQMEEKHKIALRKVCTIH